MKLKKDKFRLDPTLSIITTFLLLLRFIPFYLFLLLHLLLFSPSLFVDILVLGFVHPNVKFLPQYIWV